MNPKNKTPTSFDRSHRQLSSTNSKSRREVNLTDVPIRVFRWGKVSAAKRTGAVARPRLRSAAAGFPREFAIRHKHLYRNIQVCSIFDSKLLGSWYFATHLLSLHSGSSEPHWVYDWKHLRHWQKLSSKCRSYLMGQNIVAVFGWDASAHLADQQKLWSPASHPPIETPLLFRDCSLCSYYGKCLKPIFLPYRNASRTSCCSTPANKAATERRPMMKDFKNLVNCFTICLTAVGH